MNMCWRWRADREEGLEVRRDDGKDAEKSVEERSQGHPFLDLVFKHLNKKQKKHLLDCEEEGCGFHGCKTKTD